MQKYFYHLSVSSWVFFHLTFTDHRALAAERDQTLLSASRPIQTLVGQLLQRAHLHTVPLTVRDHQFISLIH